LPVPQLPGPEGYPEVLTLQAILKTLQEVEKESPITNTTRWASALADRSSMTNSTFFSYEGESRQSFATVVPGSPLFQQERLYQSCLFGDTETPVHDLFDNDERGAAQFPEI